MYKLSVYRHVSSFISLADIKLWIGEGEPLEDLWLNGRDDGGVDWGQATWLFGELGVKVAHRLLPTLQEQTVGKR